MWVGREARVGGHCAVAIAIAIARRGVLIYLPLTLLLPLPLRPNAVSNCQGSAVAARATKNDMQVT